MRKRHLFWIIPTAILVIAVGGFFIYTSIYYHADKVAFDACKSTDKVEVSKKDSYYFFDGVGTDDAIIFYPGAKVETEAYAPLCMSLANEGVDVFLVDMPFHFAFFGMNKADTVVNNYQYKNYYISGHSLGGAIAAKYAFNNSDKVAGAIMLAAYSVDKLDSSLNNILIYGSNDHVMNKDRYNSCLSNSSNYYEHIIEGGNHAGFAYYGNQKGDGELLITREKQIEETTQTIITHIH